MACEAASESGDPEKWEGESECGFMDPEKLKQYKKAKQHMKICMEQELASQGGRDDLMSAAGDAAFWERIAADGAGDSACVMSEIDEAATAAFWEKLAADGAGDSGGLMSETDEVAPLEELAADSAGDSGKMKAKSFCSGNMKVREPKYNFPAARMTWPSPTQ